MLLDPPVRGLTFYNAHGERFKLSAQVEKLLKSYIQTRKTSPEAGGVLLGRYLLETHDVVVDWATGPKQKDRRGRFSYIRQPAGHQIVIDAQWHTSHGTCHYLGEWHTHPETVPRPSSVDQMNWKRLLRSHSGDNDPLYFVIVGTQTIKVWQGYKNSLQIELLTAVVEG